MVRRKADRPEKPATGPMRGATSPAFLLAQVGAHAASEFAKRLIPLGLTPPHTGLLRVVAASEGQSQQALSDRLSIVPSRLVQLVDELEERGLVERRAHASDRRTHALYLTAKGRDALDAIGRIARDHQNELCAGLNAAERDQLASLLLRIVERQGLIRGVHPGFSSLGRKLK